MTQENKQIDLSQFDGHTPGPWEKGHNGAIERKFPGCVVPGTIATAHWCGSKEGTSANAALIAAAPALKEEVLTNRQRIAELEKQLANALRFETPDGVLDDGSPICPKCGDPMVMTCPGCEHTIMPLPREEW